MMMSINDRNQQEQNQAGRGSDHENLYSQSGGQGDVISGVTGASGSTGQTTGGGESGNWNQAPGGGTQNESFDSQNSCETGDSQPAGR